MSAAFTRPRTDWLDQAAYAKPGVDPDQFFPQPRENAKAAKAKAICQRCPVFEQCDADRRATKPTHGIQAARVTRAHRRKETRK